MTNFYESRSYAADDIHAQQSFMVRVYGWMSLGLIITAIVAQAVAFSKQLVISLITNPAVLIVLVLAQFGIAIALRAFLAKIPAIVATALFIIYAISVGVFFSVYFIFFTTASLASTFFVTAGTFGAMSAYGYFTRRDLTGIGHFCLMGLFGLIIASFVNLIFWNPMIYWVSTYAGILVFVGLTAYDTQKIKYLYMAGADGSGEQQKAAIIGAFELYLDFVILFQYLIRLLGKARD